MADHRNRRNRNYDHAAADMDYSISTSWFVLCLDFHSKYLPRVTHGIEKYVNSMFCVLPNRWGLNDRVRYAFSRPIIRVAFKTFTRWKDRNSSAPITSAERWQRTLSGICSERSAYRAACINAFSLSGTVVVRAHTSATSPTVYSLRPLHLSLPLPLPLPLSLSLSFALSPLFLASVPFPDRIFLEELNKTRFTVASFNVAYANSPLSRVRVHRRNLPGFIINLNSRETLRYSHGKRCSPWPINRPCQEVTTLLMINGPSLLPLSLKYIHSTVLGLPVHPEIPILLFSTLIPSILANIFWRIFSLSFFFLLTKFHRVT